MGLKFKIKQFTDKYGRMDLKPVNGGEPSTNNQLLYTGELAILMTEYNRHFKFADDKEVFSQTDFTSLMEGIAVSRVPKYPGLFSRHPDPYRLRLPANGRPTSFDEILGASFVAGLTDIYSAELIVRHGEKHNWQYCDVPGFENGGSVSKFILHPIKTAQELYKYYKAAKTYEKDGLRKAAQEFTWFYPMFFSHSGSSRFIYTVAAGGRGKFIDQLSILASVIVASLQTENISTKVLWFFRFKFLEITGRETWITKLAKRFYKNRESARFGKDFESALFSQYYTDKVHPFHEMVNYARLK